MKTTKSPSSPSRPLSSCFNEGMKLYDSFPNASFDQTQIASILGLSATSGSFKGLLSDLKQYGLIEKSGANEFVISTTLKEYSIADDANKHAIRFEFATRPKVFSQIIENQGNHLPDESALAGVLTARFGFNKARALKASRALRDSLEWANAIDAKGNILKPAPKAVPDSNAISINTPNMTNSNMSATEKLAYSPIAEQNSYPPAQEGAYSCQTFFITDVPLGDSRRIHIEYPDDMTEKEANKACAVLKALCQES